ncbi:MAG: YraN family protein [Pseudohongiellaceae bacterium]|nr:YraN family protein [Pseudohongiellaceae bacterium]
MPQEIPPRLFGQQQEQLAEQYLLNKGLSLLERNYLCKAGEIDLVMRDGENLVFVEVRYRKSPAHGSAIESITPNKKRKLIHAAQHYLLKHPKQRRFNCRFDVVGICPTSSSSQLAIQWIPAAFDAI